MLFFLLIIFFCVCMMVTKRESKLAVIRRARMGLTNARIRLSNITNTLIGNPLRMCWDSLTSNDSTESTIQ